VKQENDLRGRTKQFALRIIRLFSGLPKTIEAHMLGKQLLRSGTSVGANYREAYRARSKSEFIAKCGDSLRELEESAYWLELLADSGLMPPDRLQPLRNECNELTAIFVTIVKQSRDSPRP
jgi:four helix bundle protein